MNDMSQVIIPKSDQWNADDFIAGPMTFTISEVRISPGSEQPVSIVLEGTPKFYRPCKSMSRVLVQAWGPDARRYVGRSLTLYRDPTVKWAGMEIGGIRISHMSDIDGAKNMMLTATKGSRKPFKVLPLIMDKPAPAATNTGGDDAASRWANGYIAKLAEFTTIEALENFANQKSAKLAELATARADLHERVTTALATRTADLKGGSSFDDDDFGTAEIVDQETGEITEDAGPTPAQEAVEKVIAAMDAAKTDAALSKIWKDTEQHIEFMPPELGAKIETALDRNRRRLAPAEQGTGALV